MAVSAIAQESSPRFRSPSTRFEGRSCLVTGGGRGIGRAVALALAREGAHVAVAARTRSQCDEVAATIGERGLAIQADVCDDGSCQRAVAQVVDQFGSLSVVINAAGISPVRARAEAIEPAIVRQIVEINAVGAFTVSHYAAQASFESQGAIVNIASVLGTIASPSLAGYGAAKAALIHLTRTLAREWAHRGVRVNAVCPGYVETDLTAEMLAVPRLKDEVLEATPLQRLGTLEEVVAPVAFLASDDASYITGAALLVDGGMAA